MVRILFIGNSYTQRNDLPSLLTQLAAASDKAVETDRIIANGMALKYHWDKGEALEAINREAWDYVSLQEQSTLPFKNPGKMREYVRRFGEAIKERGAKPVLYLTWARQDAPERQAEIAEAYQNAGEEIGAIVVPAGVAWRKVQERHPNIVLYDKDKSHPTPAGSFLAACVFYASLFRGSPVGLKIGLKGVSEEEMSALEAAAWETVQAG